MTLRFQHFSIFSTLDIDITVSILHRIFYGAL